MIRRHDTYSDGCVYTTFQSIPSTISYPGCGINQYYWLPTLRTKYHSIFVKALSGFVSVLKTAHAHLLHWLCHCRTSSHGGVSGVENKMRLLWNVLFVEKKNFFFTIAVFVAGGIMLFSTFTVFVLPSLHIYLYIYKYVLNTRTFKKITGSSSAA